MDVGRNRQKWKGVLRGKGSEKRVWIPSSCDKVGIYQRTSNIGGKKSMSRKTRVQIEIIKIIENKEVAKY